MAEFAEMEEADAVRMVWNVWPASRLEAAKSVIPYGAIYTPIKKISSLQVVEYEPVLCKACGAALSPYAQLDFAAKLWSCPFCLSRNHFPAHYQGISESVLPAELFSSCTTIEYSLPMTSPPRPPTFIFVVDTCLAEDELSACRGALQQAVSLLPDHAQVGLVTFGTHVHVHELGWADCSKVYVFRGTKEHAPARVVEQLGLGAARAAAGAGAAPPPGAGRFVLPASECEYALSAALEALARDPFPPPASARPARCTGAALGVAAALAGACLPAGAGASRLLLLVGGPCAAGPGQVVDSSLSESIRSHKDLVKDAAPHWAAARRYYDGLGRALVASGQALDVYACSLDQVGLAEMRNAVELSGGLSVQCDSFSNPQFRDSLRRAVTPAGEEGGLGLAAHAVLEVRCSKDIRVCGLLGPAAALPLDRKSPLVSDTPVGQAGTTRWRLNSLGPQTTVASVFEITTPGGGDPSAAPQQLFLQFTTRYEHESGAQRLRVTTLSRRWASGGAQADLIQGFDQEAAAVLVARLAAHKMESEDDFDVTRWLDRSLIRLCARFGDYRRDDPDSFQLRPQLAYFPQFMFNFRRSQFCQVFGASPDETAFARMLLNRETVAEAVTMLQPLLYAYAMGVQPEPVLLDVSSISPDRVLLLDAYFYVVVFHGATVAQWRKAGYQEQPEYAAFQQLLEMPLDEAKGIVDRRFPVPRLTVCDQNGSQARFLLAKLNPSSTYQSTAALSSEVIMTDDVSLSVFTDHLKKLAVAS